MDRNMDMLHGSDIHLENRPRSKHFFIYIWILYATVCMTRNCFGATMAAIVAEGAFTKSQTGLIIAIFYIVYSALQIPCGILADKYNPERLILIGLLGAAVVNTVIFFNHNYYVMLISWALNAVAQAALWPSVFKIITSQLASKDRSMMIFFLQFSNSFGLLMGYVLAAFIPSWEYNFAVSAAVLIILAFFMYELCIRYGYYTKNIAQSKAAAPSAEKNSASSWRLFVASGFFALLPAILLRSMIEHGSKTLSPTMLMESYERISPMVGNLLNVFILTSGLLGTVLIKLALHKRLIKNDIAGMLVLYLLAMPFVIILRFVGMVPASLAVVALCGTTLAVTAIQLLVSYFTVSCFTPYGKTGTAAGLSNAAACLGIVFESYGFVYIADMSGWRTVTTLWIIMVALAALFTAIVIPFSKRFKKRAAK